MTELTRYEMHDGVAVLTMDDGKANALSHAMLAELNAALDRAEKEASALVIAGRDGKFCAGFDLKTMMSGIEAATALVSAGGEMYLRMYAYPLPIVAACTGHALAGGALLLLVSDTRIGREGEYKIGLNEVSISMPLPVLAQELARDRLSKRYLTEAAIQAKIYTPDGASKVGYLDYLASGDDVVKEAIEVASMLGKLPRQAYAYTKAKLREATIEHIRAAHEQNMREMTIG